MIDYVRLLHFTSRRVEKRQQEQAELSRKVKNKAVAVRLLAAEHGKVPTVKVNLTF